MLKNVVFLIILSVSSIRCWEALPQILSGRRSQYLVLHENGGYKYGYETGDGSAAEQSGDAANQVVGRYLYDSPTGQKISVKYSAGLQGFVPERIPTVSPAVSELPKPTNYDDEAGTGDASYTFVIDTDSYKRQEMADTRGNIKGSYSYNNEAGTHDLSYVAGENTGFVATSGSLSVPNGFQNGPVSPYMYNPPFLRNDAQSSSSSVMSTDGSYSFGYSTSDSSQQQSGDANGNVKGSYSYKNSAGSHDLSYIAGADTGFVGTGGSLSQPNGLGSKIDFISTNLQKGLGEPNVGDRYVLNADGSYIFEYSTPDASHQQSAGTNGNVKGSYSYKNSAGTHDLSYVAGANTGFVATGGSLSKPNGLGTQSDQNSQYMSSSASVDGSYSFEYATGDSSRRETGDANGNVEGSYSYNNPAGSHDLSCRFFNRF